MIITLITQSLNIRIEKQYKYLKISSEESNFIINLLIINKNFISLNGEISSEQDIQRTLNETSILHIHGPNYSHIYGYIKKTKAIKIMDPYDLMNLYGLTRFWKFKEKFIEKLIFKLSKGVVTKFPKSIYSTLSSNYKSKKYILFLDYCDDLIFKKTELGFLNDKKNIIYSGAYDWVFLPKLFFGNNQIYNIKKIEFNKQFFGEILIQTNYNNKSFLNKILFKIDNLIYSKYNIIITPQVKYDELIYKISSSKFGLQHNSFKFTLHYPKFGLTSFGNKFFSYLEGCTPIICNSRLRWNSYLVRRYQVGISVNFEMNNQKVYISNDDYNKFIKNILYVRSNQLSFSKNINRLVSFYKDLINS